jgi:cobalamin biosynthesis Mg chelatase CobN
VGLDLSGTDTMRDFGVTESEVLYLIGIEARAGGRILRHGRAVQREFPDAGKTAG